MKLNRILGGLALTAMLGGGLASCSNDMEPGNANKAGDMLLRAPKAMAYAGNQKDDPFKLGYDSKGTRAGEGVTAQECRTSTIDREKEKAFIEEKLPEQNGNLSDDMNTDGLFYAAEETTFEMYPVFSQTTTPNSLGLFYYDENGVYHEVIVWENMDPWSLTETVYNEPVLDSWVEDPDHWSGEGGYYAQYGVTYSKGIQITVPAGCTFGFFWKGHNNTGETVYYSDASKNEEVNRTDGGGNPVGGTETIHAVSFEANGQTYLGFEDWTDFDYQDWVFTCNTVLTPAKDKPATGGDEDNKGGDEEDKQDPETPETPDPDPETPDVPEVPEIQVPDDLDPGFTVDPEIPAVGGEVEVNLALDEKEDGDVRSSHLSIHIRKATDVEIFIPVPRQYYCEADDMAIVMQHEQNHMAHGGPTQFTWTLKDSELQVSLFVQYEDDGIRIWTDGVTQEVIDWCYEKCEDGITFEVWNYFNDPDGYPLLSPEELRQYLDQATITFLDEVPDHYVNSFADPNGKYDAEANPEGDDFHVTPAYPQDFDAPYEGPHQNNSDVNDIYKKNDRPTPPPVPVY